MMKNKLVFFSLYTILLFCSDVKSQSTKQIQEVRPTRRFAVASGSTHFVIDLDFDRAFDVRIEAFNDKQGNHGFCKAYPSQILAEAEWNHPLRSRTSENYDNIAYYKGYYFLLDSESFELIAAKDLQTSSNYTTIPSDVKNTVIGDDEIEVPFLVVDSIQGVIYIITSKVMLSYVIEDFSNALRDQVQIPSIKTNVTNYRGYESIIDVEYHQSRLYVTADNYTEVYQLDSKGIATPQAKLDKSFFGVDDLYIIDVALKGKYAFLLDIFQGVFVVDVSNAGLTDDKSDPFVYLSGLRDINIEEGTFIQVIGNSVQIVYMNESMPYLREYIIKGDPTIIGFILNLDSILIEPPQDTYSDDNFLYIFSGFMSLVVDHSVPGELLTIDDEDYLSEYWPLTLAKSMVSITTNTSSIVTVLESGYIAQYKFSRENPIFRCELSTATEGLFKYKLRAIQPNCASKALINPDDFETVCIVEETLELLVSKTGTEIGDTAKSDMVIFYLMIGLAVLGITVIIFIYLSRKYKNQYQLLEDQMRNQNDSTERSGNSGGNKEGRAEKKTKSPQKFAMNLQLEPIGDSDKERNTINALGSISKDEIKSGAEFGDLKPLDIDEIYGSKKKPQDESSF